MLGTMLSTSQVLNHSIFLPTLWGKDHYYSQFIEGKSSPVKQFAHGHTASKWHNQRSDPDGRFQSLCASYYPTASQQGWKELAVRGLKFLFPSMLMQAAVKHLFISTCLGLKKNFFKNLYHL